MLKQSEQIGGHYQIERILSHGGCGTLFQVRDLKDQRKYLLREWVFEEELTDHVRQIFLRKMEILRTFSSSVLPVFVDSIWEPSALYLVYNYRDGKILSEHARQNSLSLSQIRRIGISILDGLVLLHQNTIPLYHLDLHLNSFGVGEDGSVFFLDYGKAAEADGEAFSEKNHQTYSAEALVSEDIRQFTRIMYLLLTGEHYRSGTKWKGFSDRTKETEIHSFSRRDQMRIRYETLQKERFFRTLIVPYLEDPQKDAAFLRRKWKHDRTRKGRLVLKIAGGLSGLLLCLLIFWNIRDRVFFLLPFMGKWKENRYEKLLEEAAISEPELAVRTYYEATRLFPQKVRAYRECLEYMLQDEVFSQREQELFEQCAGQEEYEKPETDFISFYYMSALAYRIYEEGSPDLESQKRWFQRIKESKVPLEEGESCLENAAAYLTILNFEKKMEQTAGDLSSLDFSDYLETLWNLADKLQTEPASSITESVREAELKGLYHTFLSTILLYGTECKNEGIEKNKIIEKLDLLESNSPEFCDLMEIEECRKAVERTYQERKVIHEKKREKT